MSTSVDLKGKTVIITGCNTGIGRQTAKEIAKTGARVIMACRSEERTEPVRQQIIIETNNSDVLFMRLDLASLTSVRNFVSVFNAEEARLDILVNNAGVYNSDRSLTEDGHEMMFGVNHLGHFLLTNLLLDKLKASAPSRVVVVAALAHEGYPIQLDDLESEKEFSSFSTYGKSKSANILFATHLTNMLEGTGVTVYALHPGIIHTELARDATCNTCCCMRLITQCFVCCLFCEQMKTIEEGAETTLYCCLEPSIAQHTGRYYSDSKEKNAKPHATDPVTALTLWQHSCEMCEIR